MISRMDLVSMLEMISSHLINGCGSGRCVIEHGDAKYDYPCMCTPSHVMGTLLDLSDDLNSQKDWNDDSK